MSDWLQLDCSYCRCRFRIKSEYAHLRGRCPECGFRIAAPKPRDAAPAPVSSSDEPLGLLPLDDEEWPEAAIRHQDEESDSGANYVFASEPNPTTPSPDRPRVDSALQLPTDANIGVYSFKEEPLPASAAPVVVAKPIGPTPEVFALADAPKQTIEPPAASAPAKFEDAFSVVPAIVQPPAQTNPPGGTPPAPKIVDPLFLDEVPSPRPAAPPAAVAQPAELPAAPPVVEEAAPSVAVESARPKKKKKKKPDEQKTVASLNSNVEHTFKLSDAELNPVREEPLPDDIFLTGVWKFPFQAANLRAWVLLSLIGAVMYVLVAAILAALSWDSRFGTSAAFGILLVMLGFYVYLGCYAASALFGLVTDTANGSDVVVWPEGSFRDWFFSGFQLVWLELLACAVALPFYWLTRAAYGPFGFFIAEAFVFPVMMLSSLANDWTWIPFNGRILQSVVSRFKYFACLWLLVGLLSAALYAFFLVGAQWWLAPLFGPLFGYTWIVRGRLIGRLGRVLMEMDEPVKKKRKKKRRPGQLSGTFSGWGGEAEPKTVEAEPKKPPVAKIVEEEPPVASAGK